MAQAICMNTINILKQFVREKKDSALWNITVNLTQLFPEGEIFLVGGMVRDIAQNMPSHDYDIVIRNIPAKKLEEKLHTQGSVELVGKTFGVFKWKPKGWDEHIDIALPRTDHALGTGGYKDVEVQSDPTLHIHKDLERRDFTINAIALRLNDGEIFDPFEGLDDIAQKTIRAVGDPEERFQEDYSRILRCLRFSCQLDYDIEQETAKILTLLIQNINDKLPDGSWLVPRELVAKEMIKAFISNPVKALDLYDTYSALPLVLPGIEEMKTCPQPENWHSEGDVYTHTRLALSILASPEFECEFGESYQSLKMKNPRQAALVIFGTLFHDIGKPQTIETPEQNGTDRIRFNNHDTVGAMMSANLCERLALSSPEKAGINCGDLSWIVRYHMVHAMGDINEMKHTTLEKYFFNPNAPGDAMLKVMWLDASATIEKAGNKPAMTGYNALKKRLAQVKYLLDERNRLPAPLVNGNEIMDILHIPANQALGIIIDALREEQLKGNISTKEQALEYLKNNHETI